MRPSAEPADDLAGLLRAHHLELVRLAALPRRRREVLVLRYYVGLSEAEIATTLGISPGT